VSLRSRSRLLSAVLVLTILAALLPGAPAMAETTEPPLTLSAAIASLQAYGIVDKKPQEELRLSDTITRAEVAKVLGAALKAQTEAQAAIEPAFPDTDGHWANGWVAVVRSRGLFLGRPDGHFYPQSPVTYAEVLTVLLRLTGRSQEAAADWPWGAINEAIRLGMVPSDLSLGGRWQEPAPRRDVFRLTAIAVGRIPVLGTRKTLLQNLHDAVPPTLVLSGFPKVTSERVPLLTGEAGDAVTVLVGGKVASLQPGGTFSVQYPLQAGENAIPVAAIDGAGNRTESSASITFQVLARVAIEPSTVPAAVAVPFSIPVLLYDSQGRAAVADVVTWSFDGLAFTYDEATKRFTPKKPGQYQVKARVDGYEAYATVVVAGPPAAVDLQISSPTLVAGGLPAAITVRVLDAEGRLNTAGNQTLTLATVPTGVATLDQMSVTAKNGQAVVYLAPGSILGGIGVQARLSAGGKQITSPVLPVSIEQRRFAGIRLETVPAYVEPAAGRNVTVIATAVDQTGAPVPVPDDVTVTLRSGNSAVLRAQSGTALIKAGTSTSDFGGQNATFVTVGGAGTAQVLGSAGAVAVKPAAVTADRADEVARLEVRVVQPVAMADSLSAAVVAVARVDAQGRVVTYNRSPVVLLSPSTSLTISPLSDTGGVATFAIRSGQAGRVALTAGMPGRADMNSQPAELAFVQSSAPAAQPAVLAASNTVKAGEATTVYVALRDSSGGAKPNPGPALTYLLQASGGATLSRSEVVIPSGATRTEDVVLNAPAVATSIAVTATLVGGKSIQAAQISVQPASGQPGTPTASGPNLVVIGPTAGRDVVAGEDTRFVIQARDGNQVRNGAYAFGLKVKLNGVELSEMPPNLSVSFGRSGVLGIVGRTTQGQAEVWVRYEGTGTVELVPVPAATSTNAWDQFGTRGTALATTGMQAIAARVAYKAGPLDHLQVAVDPSLGGSAVASVLAAKGRTVNVRLKPVDAFGNVAANSCSATLTRLTATPADSLAIRLGWADTVEHSTPVTSLGYAEFTIVVKSDQPATSEWMPALVCGKTTVTAPNIRLFTTMGLAPAPVIEYLGGNVSGTAGVRNGDQYLNVRMAQMPLVTSPVELVVYDGDSVIGRFGPVYLNQSDPAKRTVSIPKSKLGGINRALPIKVRVNTGADVGDASPAMTVYFTSAN